MPVYPQPDVVQLTSGILVKSYSIRQAAKLRFAQACHLQTRMHLPPVGGAATL